MTVLQSLLHVAISFAHSCILEVYLTDRIPLPPFQTLRHKEGFPFANNGNLEIQPVHLPEQ